MTAPYDPFPAIAALAQLLITPEGQKVLTRLLGEAGITQAQLDAAVREVGLPKPPTVPRPNREEEA